jgi:D-alanyl-lipoteichoic acid acyltransferase DltB (MBOAT superfamily)
MAFNQPTAFLFFCGVLLLLSFEFLRPLRRILFSAASVAFVGMSYFAASENAKANPGWLIFLALFIAVHFLSLRVMLLLRQGSARTALYWGWFVGMMAVFLVVKQYLWLTVWIMPGAERLLVQLNNVFSRGDASLPVVTLGLSFLIFRQIHMAVEVRDGMLKDFGFIDYVSYLLAFWTFNAGPVQRFEDFSTQFNALSTRRSRVTATEVLLGLNRVMLGYLKMFVVSTWLGTFTNTATYLKHPDFLHFIGFLLAFPLFLYMNFSGYCDIMIGLAKTVGFILPENFNHPLLARNIVDYWMRWHMTLSQFFRDYMYLPIYSSLRRRVPQAVAMSITSMLAFFVMGIWHDKTVGMAVFGLLHGGGVVIVNLYGDLLKKLLTREQMKRYRQSRIVEGFAIVLCQTYIVFTYLFFAYKWTDLMEVMHRFLQNTSG